jgi:hypothetical protein
MSERDALVEGRIEVVSLERRRAALNGDHALAATTLVVDVGRGVFDKAGGYISVNGVVYTYTDYTEADDDLTGTLTLTSGLTGAADDGDWVNDYDPLYQAIATDLTAQVRLPSAVDNDDLLHATFAQHLADKIGEDIRGVRGEHCLMELDHDLWRVVDILGLSDPSALGTLFYDGPNDDGKDAITVDTPGDQTIILTYLPITHSEHLYWNGVYQRGTEWTRDGQLVTVPDPGGVIAVGDLLVMEYAYRSGEAIVGSNGGPVESVWTIVDTANGDSEFSIPEATEEGDLMLLFAGRNITEDPDGWTQLAFVSYNVDKNVALYARVSDGTETTVSWEVGSTNAAGVLVVIRDWVSYSDANAELVTPAPESYTPPGGNLKFAALDGDIGFQEIESVDPVAIEIRNTGFWGMAAAGADGVFNGVGTGEGQVWYGISVDVI